MCPDEQMGINRDLTTVDYYYYTSADEKILSFLSSPTISYIQCTLLRPDVFIFAPGFTVTKLTDVRPCFIF